jgi:coenzyme F420-reducing hydrogenase alpha subunit
MRAEGDIRIRLAHGGAEIVNRRQFLPPALLQGKPPAMAADLLPKLFAVCAFAQGSAAARACEMAMAAEPAGARDNRRRFLVMAEAAREHLQRLLLASPDILGETPTVGDLAALRALMQGLRACAAAGSKADWSRAAAAVVSSLRGLSRDAIHFNPTLADPEDAVAAFLAWVEEADCMAARLCRRIVAIARADVADDAVDALPVLDSEVLAARLLGEGGAAFAAHPTWDGRARETTAFSRNRAAPLVAGLEVRYGDGVLTRLAARQVEIATLALQIEALAAEADFGDAEDAPFALAEGRRDDGVGIAQIETARGRLIHAVRLANGLIAEYRILAPTEWNFHPDGAAAARLSRLLQAKPAESHLTGAADRGSDSVLEAQARLLIEAFDPCVAYTLTVQ